MKKLPSTKRLYRALVERDPAFEGVFFVGVKTTGIFCRPGCTARKPLPQNCTFYATAAEALHGGFRPCRRCNPLERGKKPPPVVAALMKRVETDPSRRITDDDIRALGVDPSTARRQFRRHCGMTFHAFQRARRMGLALQSLRHGQNVTGTAAASGYESLSGFNAAFAGIFGKAPTTARDSACLLAERITSPLGEMVAVANDSQLLLLEFHDRRALERELEWLRRRHKTAIVPGSNAVLKQIKRELRDYFVGRLSAFETPIALDGSAFQIQVWRELMAIEPGQTRSYGEMAERLKRPGASRAIGRANGENRLAIVIPCHRVIRSDGTLCGYGGGIWRKQRLLELERGDDSGIATDLHVATQLSSIRQSR